MLKISAKFTIGFGLLFFLLFTVAASGYWSLQQIHKTETTIRNNREIQRLVLSMDRSLLRARYLHAGFFQNFQQIGIRKAHKLYAQSSVREAAKAITLSGQLQKALSNSQVDSALRDDPINISLYLSSAKRFAATSIVSFELATKLAAPKTGQEALLAAQFTTLQKDIAEDPTLQNILEQMHSSLNHYYLTKERPAMQTVVNITAKLTEAVNKSPQLSQEQQITINEDIYDFISITKKIVAINEQIKSNFKDFIFQEENLTSTAQTLMTNAHEEVKQAHTKIDHTRKITLQINILITAFGLTAALAIILLLNRSITSRVLRLTQTAEKLRKGDLSVTFDDTSSDELGTLAHAFTAMTSQRSADIKQLHAANQTMLEAQDALESAVDERTNELQKLLTISTSLASSSDTSALLRKCTALAKELLNFDFSTLMLLSADHKKLIIQDTIGFPEKTIGTFTLIHGQGLSTYVVRHKQPTAVTNFYTEDRFDIPPMVFEHKITSALCTPMVIGDQVIGIFIGHTHEQRDFSKSEISLYQSLANQAAVAIDNALHVKEIEDSEKKFHTFFDNANDAIIIFEPEGPLLEVNQIACDSLGYSREELLLLKATDLIAPDFLSSIPQRFNEIIRTGKQIFESGHLDRNGRIIPVELSCTFFEFNKTPAILAVARDISERKMMEKELIKIERLESVGVLAGGIAHDFNNILASVLGNINLARLDRKLTIETQGLLEEAERASIRARGLTQQLLTFAKGGDPIKQITSVAEMIQDCGDFVLRGSNVSCQYEFDDDLWFVEIDKGQISQVIQNLIINARHAMPNGGSIVIRCQNSKNPPGVNPAANTDKYLKITIKDCGIGIPSHIIDKIFDPYFTTKQEGSGLGLAVSHSIIQKHSGFIFATSTLGKGTTFSIYLPACSPPEEPKVLSDTAPSLKRVQVSGRVLVMDDDPMVLRVTKAILTKLGYDVVPAEDGREAIRLYREAQEINQPIHIVIMDLTIPGGMGGKEAVQEILAIDPAAKVMVSSGYSNDPVMANFQKYGFQGAVSKPFQVQELRDAINNLMKS